MAIPLEATARVSKLVAGLASWPKKDILRMLLLLDSRPSTVSLLDNVRPENFSQTAHGLLVQHESDAQSSGAGGEQAHARAEESRLQDTIHSLQTSSRSATAIRTDVVNSPNWAMICRPDAINQLLDSSGDREASEQSPFTGNTPLPAAHQHPSKSPGHAVSAGREAAQESHDLGSASTQPVSPQAQESRSIPALETRTLTVQLLGQLPPAAQSQWASMHQQEATIRQQSKAHFDDRCLYPPPNQHQQIPPKKRKSPDKTTTLQDKQRLDNRASPGLAADSNASVFSSTSHQAELDLPAANADASDSCQSSRLAASEQEVQSGFCLAFRILKGLLPQAPWHAWDTSKGGIHGVKGKVDVTFTFVKVMAYAQAVLLMELKRVLDIGSYREAIGQIMDRRSGVFGSQPSRRQFMAIVAGSDQLEVLVIQPSGITLRSGLLPFSWESNSAGLHLLLRVVQAPASVHGFMQPVQPDFDLQASGRVTGLTLVDMRAAPREISKGLGVSSSNSSSSRSMPPLGEGQQSPTRPQTRVFKGTFTPFAGCSHPSGAVAVKYSSAQAIKREAANLQELRSLGVPHLIGLVGQAVIQDQPVLVTTPWGRCISIDDSPAVILSAIHAAAETLQVMAKLQEPRCHGDLSLGNIIVTCNYGEQGTGGWETFVLDWVTMRKEKPEEQVDPRDTTGTLTFMALSVMRGYVNTVSSDLESLALVLIFLASRAHCPWALKQRLDDSLAYKVASLTNQLQWRNFADKEIQPGPLKNVADSLHQLFWGPSCHTEYMDNYNNDVSPEEFLQALSLE